MIFSGEDECAQSQEGAGTDSDNEESYDEEEESDQSVSEASSSAPADGTGLPRKGTEHVPPQLVSTDTAPGFSEDADVATSSEEGDVEEGPVQDLPLSSPVLIGHPAQHVLNDLSTPRNRSHAVSAGSSLSNSASSLHESRHMQVPGEKSPYSGEEGDVNESGNHEEEEDDVDDEDVIDDDDDKDSKDDDGDEHNEDGDGDVSPRVRFSANIHRHRWGQAIRMGLAERRSQPSANDEVRGTIVSVDEMAV